MSQTQLNNSPLSTEPNSSPATPATAPTLPSSANSEDNVHACWNEIGVYGNGKCEELQKFIHCRNCPVYSTAGVQLLNRQLTPEYRRERTEHFAREKKMAVPSKISAVLFRISNEWLALSTQAFQEVAERRLVHSLPHRRQGMVLGLVNVRGELLICVSLGRLLGLERATPLEAPRKTHERLMVVSWEGNRLAFPVDAVDGIHRFQPTELKTPPATVSKSSPTWMEGVISWRDHSVGFLDANTLFASLNRSLT